MPVAEGALRVLHPLRAAGSSRQYAHVPLPAAGEDGAGIYGTDEWARVNRPQAAEKVAAILMLQSPM